MIDRIVKYIIEEATQETTTGSYTVYFDEITRDVDNVTMEYLHANHDAIKTAIDTCPEVLSETWDEVHDGVIIGYDINLCLDYCPNYEEEEEF